MVVIKQFARTSRTYACITIVTCKNVIARCVHIWNFALKFMCGCNNNDMVQCL